MRAFDAPGSARVPAHREPPASTPPIVEERGRRPAIPAAPPCAAALIRRLGGRTEADLRRELDRFFDARPGLGGADRAADRAMARFRNQLLHNPRSGLRGPRPTRPRRHPILLYVVGRLFGLADAPPRPPLPDTARPGIIGVIASGKLEKGGRDSNSETFRATLRVNESRPAELGQQPEASLAWRRGDPPCEA